MPIAVRRVLRLSVTVGLSLAISYALGGEIPFMGPLFALMLSATPAPPMKPKALVGLVLLTMLTMSLGLLLVPMLIHYPMTALILVACGLLLSNFLSVNKGKGLVGSFLTIGITLISAAGQLSFQLAVVVVNQLVVGIITAVLCLWIVYPFFPEDPVKGTPPPKKKKSNGSDSLWIAIRATVIVMPAYLLALTNPAVYMPIIMKSVSLGQQDSVSSSKHAGRELLGSTFVGGCLAALFWIALKSYVNLWMFSLWMVLFMMYIASKLYRVKPSKYPASFWINAAVTMLILLGPAVQDSAGGKDVYKAFAVRLGLFFAVTFYAWAAVVFMEYLFEKRQRKKSESLQIMEKVSC